MAADQEAPESSPPRNMTNHCPSFPSMRSSDPDDILELVWENGDVLIRGLSTSSKRNDTSTSAFPSSNSSLRHFPQREGSTKDEGVNYVAADSTLGEYPSWNLSVSGLTKFDGHQHEHDHNKRKKIEVNYSSCNCTCKLGTSRPQLLSDLYGGEDGDDDHFNVVNSQLPEVRKLECCCCCYLDGKNNREETHVVPENRFIIKDLRQLSCSCNYGEIIPGQQDSDCEVPQSPLNKELRQVERNNDSGSRLDDDENDQNEKRQRVVNFPIFVRPIHDHQALPKSSNHVPTTSSCGATRPTSTSTQSPDEAQGKARSSIPAPPTTTSKVNTFDSMVRIEPTNDSKHIGTSKEGNGADGSELPRKDINDPLLLPDDQQSEAVVGNKQYHNLSNTRFQYKSTEKVVANSCNSAFSREASNSPTYTLKRRYEDTTDLSSTQIMEEGEAGKPPVRGSKGGKAKRKAQVHNFSERKRRDKINKKMRALKELIPNCNKEDKASMLDEAIEYLKTLQLQLQMMMMMSMGSGVYTMPPPVMMLPTAMQHINAQHLASWMRMRMQPPPPPPPLALQQMGLNMVGFQDAHQVLMMSMSSQPFSSLAANPSATTRGLLFPSQLPLLHAAPPPPHPPPPPTSTNSNPTSH